MSLVQLTTAITRARPEKSSFAPLGSKIGCGMCVISINLDFMRDFLCRGWGASAYFMA